MLIAEKIMQKDFKGRNTKDAYLSCCKWIASNIIAVNNSRHVTYRIEKIKDSMFGGVVRFTAYVVTDEEEINEHNCEICKEVNSIFYTTDGKYRCASCRIPPYRKRMEERLESLKDGMKGTVL